MRKQLPIMENPLNADERMLYGIAMRLDRIIELLEDVIEEKQTNPTVAVEQIADEITAEVMTEVKAPKTRKKKGE